MAGLYIDENYQSNYYQKKKLEFKENSRIRYKNQPKVECECGKIISTVYNYKVHLRSKLHKKRLDKLNISE